MRENDWEGKQPCENPYWRQSSIGLEPANTEKKLCKWFVVVVECIQEKTKIHFEDVIMKAYRQ